MQSREKVCRFIENQFKEDDCSLKKNAWHYGLQDLRELLDFIYGGKPKIDKNKLKGSNCR